MDHDISTNDKWTMDKVLLKPGIVVDIMNRFGEREQELLTKISDLTDELREVKAAHIRLGQRAGVLPIEEPLHIQKSVEDYAIVLAGGMAACFRNIEKKTGETQTEANAKWVFNNAEAMVAERDKRGIGK